MSGDDNAKHELKVSGRCCQVVVLLDMRRNLEESDDVGVDVYRVLG